MTGAQPVKGAVRLLQVVDGVTRTAYSSRVQLTGVTRHIEYSFKDLIGFSSLSMAYLFRDLYSFYNYNNSYFLGLNLYVLLLRKHVLK